MPTRAGPRSNHQLFEICAPLDLFIDLYFQVETKQMRAAGNMSPAAFRFARYSSSVAIRIVSSVEQSIRMQLHLFM